MGQAYVCLSLFVKFFLWERKFLFLFYKNTACVMDKGVIRMYILRTEHEFDAAHFLKGYEGKCSNIHGHRWRVVVSVGDDKLQSEGNTRGMVVDFSQLKDDVKRMVNAFDHKLIIEDDSLKLSTVNALLQEDFDIISLPMRPTAENFAKYFYDSMKGKGYHVVEVLVYETPNNCAAYRE